MKCNQCDSFTVNGVYIHEKGCPNSHINLETGKPHDVECDECGCVFEQELKGQQFCGEDCACAYYGRKG